MEMGVKLSNHSVDRLSSLSDDVIIEIISFLPLQFAIVTGSLSRRWCGLWTKVTSINIKLPDFKNFPDFMSHITSPSIYRFFVKYAVEVDDSISLSLLDFWFRQACDRNVRELKLACPPRFKGCSYRKNILPSFVLQTHSLTSIELYFVYNLQLPDDGQINLPNLKRLRFTRYRVDLKLLGTLIEACPSLEDLSLIDFFFMWTPERDDIKVFNRNLRRLVIDTGCIEDRRFAVVINAPKLEQLVCHTVKSAIFSFEVKPSALCEVKIEFINHNVRLQSRDEKKVMSEFYQAISNVSSLTLDDYVLHKVSSTVFCNVTRCTLIMKKWYNIKTVASLLELCPLLDVLTLKFDWDRRITRERNLGKPNRKRTSRRVLKRLEIEAYCTTYRKPGKSFLKLVQYLLSGAIDLEHFYFRAVGPKFFTEEVRKRMESKLCKLICECPMASSGCKVQFEGMFHKYVSRSNQG
ncbi:F-box/FBD/LRR-repeat protein At5g22700-like [Silene latifolia]|uniref:F-box/FBD/LRR-repeat protein At5g22700-like n=1 Tax=Silene latifolia TaxID=37657 RepID=UPI003D77A549